MTTSNNKGKDERSIAQFFFEQGYFSCWADGLAALDKPLFELTDEKMDRAWAIAPMCQDTDEDYAEFDRQKALADAAQELLEVLQLVVRKFDDAPDAVKGVPLGIMKARAAIAKATGEAA